MPARPWMRQQALRRAYPDPYPCTFRFARFVQEGRGAPKTTMENAHPRAWSLFQHPKATPTATLRVLLKFVHTFFLVNPAERRLLIALSSEGSRRCAVFVLALCAQSRTPLAPLLRRRR